MIAPTIETWRAHALARGDDAPAAASDEIALQALVRGQDYIEATYPSATQPYLLDRAERAIYIAAGVELETPGFWSVIAKASDAKVLTEVGSSIKWTPIDGGKVGDVSPRHSLIDSLLGTIPPLPGVRSV